MCLKDIFGAISVKHIDSNILGMMYVECYVEIVFLRYLNLKNNNNKASLIFSNN